MQWLKKLWRFFRIPSQRTVRYYADEFVRLKTDAARKDFVLTADPACQHGQYELTRLGTSWYFHRLMDVAAFLESSVGPRATGIAADGTLIFSEPPPPGCKINPEWEKLTDAHNIIFPDFKAINTDKK